MVYFPKLSNVKNKSKKAVYAFGGINKKNLYSFGELETSENISLLSYPALGGAPKKQSASLCITSPEDVIFSGGIISVKNKLLYYSKTTAPNSYITAYSVSEGKKEAACVGNYLVVYPDKACCNLKTKTWKSLDATFSVSDQNSYYSSDYIRFRNYSDFTSFKNSFSEGDTIEIEGAVYADNYRAEVVKKTLTVREIENSTYKIFFDPNSFDVTSEKSGAITTFKRTSPTLSHICGHGGRVWGISEEKEIKASKYQNPFNFNFYDLSAADSYTLETSEPEPFTASYSMGDYVLFFKENMIYRITGTKPANFRTTKILGKGVKLGCERSLAQKNGTVFYVGSDGVYACGGAEPKKISEEIGDLSDVERASGGFFGNVYYVSLKRNKKSETYGFDTEKGMWFKSGDDAISSMGELGGELWYFKEDKTLFKFSSEAEREKNFSVTLREYDEREFNQKGFSKLYLKYNLEEGGYIKVETSVDFEPFKDAAVVSNSRKNLFEFGLFPNRGDNLRIRISLFGGGELNGIMREYFSHGSAV